MYVKIEPTGTVERKGMVQVRFSFYLESGDYGYDECHVTLPNFEGQEYKGELDKEGNPKDPVDYQKWVDGLPTFEQDNPFHNHFYAFEPTVTNDIVMDKGEELCKEAYEKWAKDETPTVINPKVEYPAQVVSARKAECDEKVSILTSTEFKRDIPLKKDAR